MRTRLAVWAALVLAVGARASGNEGHEKGHLDATEGESGQNGQSKGDLSAQGESALPQKDPAARAQAAPQVQSVIGTVEKLGQDSLTVKSSPLSDPRKLSLGKETKFTRDGRAISRSDIHEGDQVRASFAGTGASPDAIEVSVVRKGDAAQGGPKEQGQPSGMDQGTKAAPAPGQQPAR